MEGFKEVQWNPTGSFVEIFDKEPTRVVMAVSSHLPTVGKEYKLQAISSSTLKVEERKTSPVRRVIHIEREVYKVETDDVIYFVNMLLE